jgi:16S rRNA (guanine527-N7)-methyltransferase
MKAGDDLADRSLLEQGLEMLRLPEAAGDGISRNNVVELLWTYIKEIELFNEAYGLVKVSSRKELIVKHILDSLAPLSDILKAKILPRSNTEEDAGFTNYSQNSASPRLCVRSFEDKAIADVGSGAGLPGIPMAICMPQAKFTLIERMGRRTGFLRNCIAVLGLDNVQVEEVDLEKAQPGRFDMAVFRAFRPLTADIHKGLTAILKPNGMLAAWKGRLENVQEEIAAVEKSVPGLIWKIIPLTVPFLEEERHLVIISN